MKTIARIAFIVAAFAASGQALAATTAEFVKWHFLSYNAQPKEGYWHRNLSKAKAYAVENKMPLVVVWSNGDACGHCVIFEKACLNSNFKKYMESSGIVWVFGYPKDPDGARNTGPIYKFAYKNQNQFPLIRVYWPAGGVDTYTKGDDVTGATAGATGAKNTVNYFKKVLKKYNYSPKPETPPYYGGEFGVANYEEARLEAEAGFTKWVELPLTRTNSVSAANAAVNTVIAVYPDGHSQTNVVEWKAGETERNIEYDTTSLVNVGDAVEITIYNSTNGVLGAAMETTGITAVERENSPKNPCWIGERTEDTLKWGEWTMDLDVATNKVANASGENAYTMVLIGGSMWCPDCSAADYNCFDREEFKNWAASNRIALVSIDIPNNPTQENAPSLLTYAVNKTSERYWTCNYTKGYTNEALKVQSGSGYLSRHMIKPEEAAEIAARNRKLVGTDTLNGGWNRPERANKARTGVPLLMVLRKDGSIAGRFGEFSDIGPTEWSEGYLKRFEEMFAQTDAAEEESNDSYTTATETVGLKDEKSGRTLSFTDAQDVYVIDSSTTGKLMDFTAKGDEDVLVEVKVLSADGTIEASANGSLKEGVSVQCTIEEAGWFVLAGTQKGANYTKPNYADPVKATTWRASYPSDARFAHTNASSTVVEYSLASDFVLLPAEETAKVAAEAGDASMKFMLEEGKEYRITGIDAAANAETLEVVESSSSHYRAKTGGVKEIVLAAATTMVEYQMWKPGKVGFKTGSAFTHEDVETFKITLSRTGGLSGRATAKVSFNAEKSSAYGELFTLPDGFGDELTWDEMDGDDKILEVGILDNSYADGDQKLYFDVECGGDATAGITQFCLTIRDNDVKKSGKLFIAGCEPSISKSMKVYAKSGDKVKIFVGRKDGMDGGVSAALKTTLGKLDKTMLGWEGRDGGEQTATLDLSGVAAGKTAKVSLVPSKGTAVDSSRRILTVETVPAGAPGFADAAVSIAARKNVLLPETGAAELDANATDSVKVKLFAGALPPGVKWKYDAEGRKIVLYGVPSKAGSFTASFRAYEGKTAGTSVAVTVDVADSSKCGFGDGGKEPLNAYTGISRTFSDAPITNTTGRLDGVVALALPPTGRASAKCRMASGGTLVLSAPAWSEIDPASGVARVVLSGKAAGAPGTLDIAVKRDGKTTGTLSLEDEDGGEAQEYQIDFSPSWSKKNPADDFAGYYTVSMPQKTPVYGTPLASGDAFLTLKMTSLAALNSGRVAYSGMLPNGKSFSGSTTLAGSADPSVKRLWAIAPILLSNAEDSLFGAVKIRAGAMDPDAAEVDENYEYAKGRAYYKLVRRSVYPADGCGMVWRFTGKTDAISHETEFDVFGGIYDSTEDFASCCSAVLGSSTGLKLFALAGFNNPSAEVLDDLEAGEVADGGNKAVTSVKVTFAKASKSAKTKTNSITSGDKKLSFSLATGVVSGTMTLQFEGGARTLSYQGIVMPNWGNAECSDCGNRGAEATLRPFVSGSAWFADRYETDGRRVRVRRSCPVSIGVEAGQ